MQSDFLFVFLFVFFSQMPVGNAMEAGHAGAPLGYVIPAFRGGGIKNDFALR